MTARYWPVEFKLKIDTQTLRPVLAGVEALVRTLRGLPLPAVAISRMEKLNIVRAIHGTTGIEGNTMTEDAVARIVDIAGEDRPWTVEERENVNAVGAMEYMRGKAAGHEPRITEAFVKEIHRLYTKGIPNPWNEPGKYRRDTVYAGAQEFAKPEDIPSLMRDFARFVNSAEVMALPPLLRAVTAHFFLVSLHPFGDGNGRVGRALEAFIIHNSGYASAGFYSLSNYYYRNRKMYIDLLVKTCFDLDGDLTEFAAFALSGFVEELAELNKIALPYLALTVYNNKVDEAVAAGKISQRVGVALKHIAAAEDGIAPRELIGRIDTWSKTLYRGRSERTIREDLTQMRQSGLIEERAGRIYPNLETQT